MIDGIDAFHFLWASGQLSLNVHIPSLNNTIDARYGLISMACNWHDY